MQSAKTCMHTLALVLRKVNNAFFFLNYIKYITESATATTAKALMNFIMEKDLFLMAL